MEIVVFIAFLIVPVFTVVAFVMTLIQRKQVKALKELVKQLASSIPENTQTKNALFSYEMERI